MAAASSAVGAATRPTFWQQVNGTMHVLTRLFFAAMSYVVPERLASGAERAWLYAVNMWQGYCAKRRDEEIAGLQKQLRDVTGEKDRALAAHARAVAERAGFEIQARHLGVENRELGKVRAANEELLAAKRGLETSYSVALGKIGDLERKLGNVDWNTKFLELLGKMEEILRTKGTGNNGDLRAVATLCQTQLGEYTVLLEQERGKAGTAPEYTILVEGLLRLLPPLQHSLTVYSLFLGVPS